MMSVWFKQNKTLTFEKSRLLNSNIIFRESKMIPIDRLPTMEAESDNKLFTKTPALPIQINWA